jgi:hypothetical protein
MSVHVETYAQRHAGAKEAGPSSCRYFLYTDVDSHKLLTVMVAGAGGSGRLLNQRRRRNARSLRVRLPNSAVVMIVSIKTISMMAMAAPSAGWNIPALTGTPSEAAAAPTSRRQGIRSLSGELGGVTDPWMPVNKVIFPSLVCVPAGCGPMGLMLAVKVGVP